MTRLIFLVLLIMLQFILSPFSTASTAEKIKVTGIYSSLVFNKEGGDVLGDEIIVGFSREGYYVVFQTSEGEPIVPVVVPAIVSNQKITFTLPAPMNERGQFIGKISRQGLVGKFQGTGQVLRLKRKTSYWQ
jgi:hypothetical protein